jgi:hypothetical protein
MTEFPVEMVSPDGRVATATSPREYNDLKYGGGYREKEAEKPKAQTPAKQKPTEGTP